MSFLTPTCIGKSMLFAVFLCQGMVAGAHPANCQVQVSETTLDYGSLTRSAIMAKPAGADRASLGDRQMTLNVLCQEPTAIALMIRGPADQESFRFGEHGRFAVRLSDAMLDGRPVSLGVMQAATKIAPEENASVKVRPGSVVFPFTAERGMKAKSLSLQVHIEPVVSAAATRVRERTTWQGSAVFSVVERTRYDGNAR